MLAEQWPKFVHSASLKIPLSSHKCVSAIGDSALPQTYAARGTWWLSACSACGQCGGDAEAIEQAAS